jgi:hypothetical protein
VDAVGGAKWSLGPSLDHASARAHEYEGGVKRGQLRPAPLSAEVQYTPISRPRCCAFCLDLVAVLDVTRPPGNRWEQVCDMTCRARCMHALEGSTTTPNNACSGMVPIVQSSRGGSELSGHGLGVTWGRVVQGRHPSSKRACPAHLQATLRQQPERDAAHAVERPDRSDYVVSAPGLTGRPSLGCTCLEWVGVRGRCGSVVAIVWTQQQALRGRCQPAFGGGQCSEAWQVPVCSAVSTSACALPPVAVHGAAESSSMHMVTQRGWGQVHKGAALWELGRDTTTEYHVRCGCCRGVTVEFGSIPCSCGLCKGAFL